MKDPQQELFTTIRTQLVELYGEDRVFDGYLPPEETPYPFVYLGDSQTVDDLGNKSVVLANIFQHLTIWGSPTQRGTLSDMAADIKALLRGIRDTGTYAFRILHISSQFDEEPETRTIRVDIDAEYKLQGGS